MSTVATPACPLCRGTSSKVSDSLRGKDLLQLWRVHGDDLSSEALLPIREDSLVELRRCEACGFQFFDPSLGGGPRFYEELARNPYYAADCAEFGDVLDFAGEKGVREVLDIGCGHGAFLDLAAARGMATSGLELTPAAAEYSAKRGHRVLTTPLEDLAPNALPSAGLVTMFQVVEHVRDPVGFVGRAGTLAKPGGWVAVSVPNDGGINGFADLVPHQWPPHHITRWRGRDLVALGKACGFQTISVRANSLSGMELRRYLRLNARLGEALDPRRPRMSRAAILAIGWAYSLLGARYWFPRMGANITAIYRVPM